MANINITIAAPNLAKRYLAFFMVFMLLAVGCFFAAVKNNHTGRQMVLYASEMQLLSLEISQYSRMVFSGDVQAFISLKTATQAFNKRLALLKKLDASLETKAVHELWGKTEKNIKVVSDGEKLFTKVHVSLSELSDSYSRVKEESSYVAEMMAQSGSPVLQVLTAQNQVLLVGHFLEEIHDFPNLVNAEYGVVDDDFDNSGIQFNEVLSGLLNGSKGYGLQPIKDAKIRSVLLELREFFKNTVEKQQNDLLEILPWLFSCNEVRWSIVHDTPKIQSALNQLIATGDDKANVMTEIITGMLFLMAAMMSLFGVIRVKRSEAQ